MKDLLLLTPEIKDESGTPSHRFIRPHHKDATKRSSEPRRATSHRSRHLSAQNLGTSLKRRSSGVCDTYIFSKRRVPAERSRNCVLAIRSVNDGPRTGIGALDWYSLCLFLRICHYHVTMMSESNSTETPYEIRRGSQLLMVGGSGHGIANYRTRMHS